MKFTFLLVKEKVWEENGDRLETSGQKMQVSLCLKTLIW